MVRYNFIVFRDANAHIFFLKNFAERVVILLYCPKGRRVTLRPSVGGIIGR